jgi:hypothetical protein
VTKVIKTIEELMEELKIDIDRGHDIADKTDKLTAKADLLPSKLKEIQRIDKTIIIVTKTEDIETTVADAEDYTSIVEEKHTIIKRWANRILTKKDITATGTPASATATYSKPNVQLPKLHLGTFNGNVLEWMSFYDSFKAAIENNHNLSNVQKLQYLQSQLKGEASLAIEGLQLMDVNYTTAMDILKELYGRTEKIKNGHMKALWDLQKPSPDVASMKHFVDCLESNLRGLAALGIKEDSMEDLLVPLILDRLETQGYTNIFEKGVGCNVSR